MDDFGRWTKTGLKTDISNISQTGINRIQQYANAAAGNVISVNNQLPNNAGNVTLNTDNIPEGTNNLYATSTFLTNQLKNIMTTSQDMLIRDGSNNIVRLPKGANNTFLNVDNTGNVTWNSISLALSNLTDVTLTTPATDQILRYDGTKWYNTTGNFINNDFTAAGMLIIGAGNGTYQTFPRGTNGQFLKSTATSLQWSDVPFQSLANLTDVTITTIADKNFLRYNSTNSKWENKAITTDDISVGTTNKYYLDSLVSTYLLTVLTTSQDILYRNGTVLARLAKGANSTILSTNATGSLEWITNTAGDKALTDLTDVTITTPATGQVLYKSAGDWVNQTLSTSDVTEGTNKYFTTAKVDDQYKTYYANKGEILAGTGTNTYQIVPKSTVDFQCLVSDTANVLVPTAMKWATLALNNSYFSNINIATPTNNQVLSYDNATTKWVNKTVDAALLLPIIAPNNTNYWGPTHIPFQTQAGTNTGIGMRAGGGALSLFFGGVEQMAFDGTFMGTANNVQIALRTDSSLASPIFVIGTTNICVYGSANAGGTAHARWNWGMKGTANYGYIDSTSLYTASRLDVKNCKYLDTGVQINNLFNSWTVANAAGTTGYFSVEANNNRVRSLNRMVSEVQKLDAAANLVTNITANNQFFNIILGDTTSLTLTNNAGSTPNISLVANTDEFNINNASGIKLQIDLSFSMLFDKNVSVCDVSLFNITDGGIEVSQFHRRFRVDANYYFNYTVTGTYTPTAALNRISMKIKVNQSATVTATLTNLSLLVQDMML